MISRLSLATGKQYAILQSSIVRRTFCSSITAHDAVKQSGHADTIDIDQLLSTPTWSVASLLPPKEAQPMASGITSKQLHHLLRLSALPPPKSPEEEAHMLATLSSQLHFVKEMQEVDTTGIEPLQSLRDETAAGEQAAELGVDALRHALDSEEVKGNYHKRIRRKRNAMPQVEEPTWDPLKTASKRIGRFFVVEGGKKE